ncbi:Non-specific serine/threonine protein kinase [Bertholletia excelsa]
MLGQIKHGSCCPQAILFKVLADTVGLESKLMVGLPNEGAAESLDSYKHMSVIVVFNSTELLVDLMRFPGQLIPRSTKAIFMTHISAAGESDSAENDSCDSPLEPSCPLYGFSERVDPESTEKDEGFQYQRRLEASSNVAGPSLCSVMLRSSTSLDRKLSPEHPSFRARGRSMLSGDRKSFRDYADDIATSRSEVSSAPETRRLRRSISITPEISDDIIRLKSVLYFSSFK